MKLRSINLSVGESRYALSQDPKSYPAEIVQETPRSSSDIVIIWGCMSWLGADKIKPVTGLMNPKQLTSILTTLIPTVYEVENKLFSNGRNEFFCGKKTMPIIYLERRRIG